MERLKLTCGRYLPAGKGGTEERLAALEDYVGRLAAELEFRLGEAGKALETITEAMAAVTAEEGENTYE